MSFPTCEETSNWVRGLANELLSITSALETEVENGRLPPKIYSSTKNLRKIENGLSSNSRRIDEITVQQTNIVRLYEDKLLRLGQEKVALEATVESLKQDLAREKKKKPKPQEDDKTSKDTNSKSDKPDKSNKTNSTSESNQSLDEFEAKIAVDNGKSAFKTRQYKQAEQHFKEALKLIEPLSVEEASRFDTTEISYFLAVCAALDDRLDLDVKEQKLGAFLSKSEGLDSVRLSHVYHLRSQLCIQLGDLDNARNWCDQALQYVSKLPKDIQYRHEPISLLVRIRTLQGKETQSYFQQFPERWQDWFWHKYSYLRQQGKPNPTPTPLRMEPPEGIKKAPTWSLPQQQDKDSKSKLPHEKTGEEAGNKVNEVTRRKWMIELQIDAQVSVFWEPMITRDGEKVTKLLKTQSPPDKSLHVAALFGEVDIAKSLLKAGCNVNKACEMPKLTTIHNEPDGKSLCVTPMHVAIGAQQHAMIRFLASNNGSLGIPNHGKSATAPPRFLLSPGWFRMVACSDPQDVIGTVNVLLSLKEKIWNINNVLGEHKKKRTLLDYATELPDDRSGFKQAVVHGLESRGAKRYNELI